MASASNGSFYGREAFSPGRIVGQVAAIQTAFYCGDMWLLLMFDYVLGVPLRSRDGAESILWNQVFDHSTPSLNTSSGVIAIIAYYFSILVLAPLVFTYLVGRSRRALDYLCTLLLVHFVLCAVHSGFPTSSMWWFMNCSGGVATVLISEILSRRIEMREISVPERDVENPSPDDDEDAIRPA